MDELSNDTLLEIFWTMLLSRRTDERAWTLHRQGRIAFHVSAIGHEATQVGAAYALRRGEDWVVPYYRDLALILALGFTPYDFMLGLMGRRDEPSSGGRQMPSHWSIPRAHVISTGSPVAAQSPHAAGLGLAIKLRGDDRVVLTTIGEGSTSQGDWYEAVNFSAIHQLPVVFLVENNQYAISERLDKQMHVPSVAEKACGLGLPGVSADGTDVLAVYQAVKAAVDRARSGGGPGLVEARSYRITPHSSDDDDRSYRSREEVEQNKKSDPLLLFQVRLEEKGLLPKEKLREMEDQARQIVEEAAKKAEAAPLPEAAAALHPVYAEEVANG